MDYYSVGIAFYIVLLCCFLVFSIFQCKTKAIRKPLKDLTDQLDAHIAKIPKLETYLSIIGTSDQLLDISTQLNATKLVLAEFKKHQSADFIDRMIRCGKVDKVTSELSDGYKTVEECAQAIEKALLEKIHGQEVGSIAKIKAKYEDEIAQNKEALKNAEIHSKKVQSENDHLKSQEVGYIAKIRAKYEEKIAQIKKSHDHAKDLNETREELKIQTQKTEKAQNNFSLMVRKICMIVDRLNAERAVSKGLRVELEEIRVKTDRDLKEEKENGQNEVQKVQKALEQALEQLKEAKKVQNEAQDELEQFKRVQKTLEQAQNQLEELKGVQKALEQAQGHLEHLKEAQKTQKDTQDQKMMECVRKVLEQKDQADKDIEELRKELGMVHMENQKLKKIVAQNN